LPYAVAGLFALLGFGWRWIESRASREDVGAAVGVAVAAANSAAADAHHAASLADGHSAELAALWLYVVAMRAELQVLREYARADGATRGHYVELAQRYYAREYELQLSTHRNNPAEAARLALLAQWRPDRGER
jgi:hypothetical protein